MAGVPQMISKNMATPLILSAFLFGTEPVRTERQSPDAATRPQSRERIIYRSRDRYAEIGPEVHEKEERGRQYAVDRQRIREVLADLQPICIGVG